MRRIEPISATIAAGTSITPAVFLGRLFVIAFAIPALWGGFAALTFQQSFDNVTFVNLYNEIGEEISLPASPNQVIALQSTLYEPLGPWIKIRSGSVNAPITQAADRVIHLTMRD